MKTQSFKESSAGAVLIETAIILPVLILLIFGGISYLNILYTKSVIQFGLQEGLRLAQNNPALNGTRFDLFDKSDPKYAANLAEFKSARQLVIQRTLQLMRAHSLTSFDLESGDTDGALGDADLKLTLLPPNVSSQVKGWNRDYRNASKCELTTISLPDPTDPKKTTSREICGQSGKFPELIENFPTEFHAFANLKAPFFGHIKTDISSMGYLAAAPITVPVAVAHGSVVGGYTAIFGEVGAGNGGSVNSFRGTSHWGRTLTYRTPGRATAAYCEPGLDTFYVDYQRLYTTEYKMSFQQNMYGINWVDPSTGKLLNETESKLQFLCLTK